MASNIEIFSIPELGCGGFELITFLRCEFWSQILTNFGMNIILAF